MLHTRTRSRRIASVYCLRRILATTLRDRVSNKAALVRKELPRTLSCSVNVKYVGTELMTDWLWLRVWRQYQSFFNFLFFLSLNYLFLDRCIFLCLFCCFLDKFEIESTTSVKNVGKVSYFSPPLPPYSKLKYTEGLTSHHLVYHNGQ